MIESSQSSDDKKYDVIRSMTKGIIKTESNKGDKENDNIEEEKGDNYP